mgnify:CR=1 FL=1
MTTKTSFSPKGYEKLINGLLERGYKVRDFLEADPAQSHLVLRHDIDMSLEAAVEIAKLENRLGIAAHYFVLLRTEFYNIFSKNGLQAIEDIVGLGHKIGLHFDASLYTNEELESAAEWEIGCLQCVTGREVEMVSFHRPAKFLLGRKKSLAGRCHSYQPQFFEKMAYCSDSRGDWNYGHPHTLKAVQEGRALQLLTHPIWWTKNNYSGPVPILDQLANDRNSCMKKELARNCEPYGHAYPTLLDID